MKMDEFTRSAWDAYAGAEAWPNRDLPLIGRGAFEDGEEYELVLDCTGGCLVLDDEWAEAGGYVLELPFPTQAAALAFAEGMGEPDHKLDLFMLGFKPA